MITTTENRIKIEENVGPSIEPAYAAHPWVEWPVSWSAVWVGALASLAAIVVFGLIGTALGFHLVAPENRVVDLTTVGIGTFAFSIFSAFLAAVIGGWVAGKIAGIRRSEPAMLHGAITWLTTIPILIALAALGAGSYFGGWYGGLSGSPSWAAHAAAPYDRPEPLSATATEAERRQHAADQAEYRDKVREWRENAPQAARNTALGAVTALLLGLVGSVIGGWMSSGEPMTLTYYRTRDKLSSGTP
jgi:hypothetical protein